MKNSDDNLLPIPPHSARLKINPAFIISILVSLGLLTSLACSGLLPAANNAAANQSIGFNYSGKTAALPQGDESANGHVFIHFYPMPADGLINGLIYQNDADEVPESVTLLTLRSEKQGWRVINRVVLPADDTPARTSGFSVLTFDPPLPVRQGDVVAHWHPKTQPGGPFMLNVDQTAVDGLSTGQANFDSEDVEVGRIFTDNGFSGKRDYFFNVLFTTSH